VQLAAKIPMHRLLIGANHVSLGCPSHTRCYIIKEPSVLTSPCTEPLVERLGAASGAWSSCTVSILAKIRVDVGVEPPELPTLLDASALYEHLCRIQAQAPALCLLRTLNSITSRQMLPSAYAYLAPRAA